MIPRLLLRRERQVKLDMGPTELSVLLPGSGKLKEGGCVAVGQGVNLVGTRSETGSAFKKKKKRQIVVLD